MSAQHNRMLLLALVGGLALSGCDDGKDGADGPAGPPGEIGSPGLPAGSFANSADSIEDVNFVLAPENLNLSADFRIEFQMTGKNVRGEDVPFVGLDQVAIYASHLSLNDTDFGAPNAWANHSYLSVGQSSMYCQPGGGELTVRGTTYQACTLEETEPGLYVGTWEHSDAPPPVYLEGDDDSLTHRIWLRAYNLVDSNGVGLSEKVLSDRLDYIPATGEVLTDSGRHLVADTACQNCHGGEEGGIIVNIEAHHNYQSVGNCVSCHNSGMAASDEQVAEGWNEGNWDLTVLVHRLHAGAHIADSLSGEALEFMGNIHYPGELYNCQACHQDNTAWAENIYRDACVACHIDTDPYTGEGHRGIEVADDTTCVGCHGSGALGVMEAHNIGVRDTLREAFYTEVDPATITLDRSVDPAVLRFGYKAYLDGEAFSGDLSALDFISNNRSWLVNFQADSGYAWGVLLTDGKGSADFISSDYQNGYYWVTHTVPLADATGTGVIIADVRLCAEDGELVTCGTAVDDTLSLAMKTEAVYFDSSNPTNPEVALSRFATDEGGITSIALCNDCHSDIAYGKRAHHGVDQIEQCVSCHNENATDYPYDPRKANTSRELGLNVHKFHSGHSDYGEIHYPNLISDCSSCHVSDQWFDGSGALISGKRGFKVAVGGDDRLSPIANTCMACHENEAVKAHAASQGAIVDPANAVPNPPVESCAVCHRDVHSF